MALFKKNGEEYVPREDGLPDYDHYIMTKREKIFYILCAMAVMFCIGYLFYKNIVLSLILMLTGFLFPKYRTKQIIIKRKADLTMQFKDLLYALSSALSVGKSVEKGLEDCLKDLAVIYPDENTDILRELEYILRGIRLNGTVEDMFRQFGERAHIEDIDNFVDVFVTCKRTGGDIIEVIRSTSSAIGDKIETKMEIENVIAGKKMEFNVLMVLPPAMVFILSYTAGDYMEPVFTTIAGRIVMTIAIMMFAIAYVVGKKIMDIQV